MAETKEPGVNFSLSVNLKKPAERIISFDDESSAAAALHLVEELLPADKSLKPPTLSEVERRTLIVETNHPSDWMSPGIELGSTERQSSLFRKIGNLSLA